MRPEDTTQLRRQLWQRLVDEGETELADKIGACGHKVPLRCMCCGAAKLAHSKCKRKWCPSCQRILAARRAARLRVGMVLMKWPLFVTLTSPNAPYDKPERVRDMRRAFGKLRHRRIWKETVAGGVAAMEVTDKGNGWHFHIHALIDCRWLSVTVPEPRPRESAFAKEVKCKAAKRELDALWAKCCGVPVAHTWIKRCAGQDVASEIVKYSVKGSDLLKSTQPIGPLIRAIDGTRLTTTFGSLFGIAKELDDESRSSTPCEVCGESEWLPDDIARIVTARTEDQRKTQAALRIIHRKPLRPPAAEGDLDL